MNSKTNTEIPRCQICGFALLPDALEEHHISEEETMILCANCHRALETTLKSLYRKRSISSKKLAKEDPRYWFKLSRIVDHMQMKYRAMGYNVPDIKSTPLGEKYEEEVG